MTSFKTRTREYRHQEDISDAYLGGLATGMEHLLSSSTSLHSLCESSTAIEHETDISSVTISADSEGKSSSTSALMASNGGSDADTGSRPSSPIFQDAEEVLSNTVQEEDRDDVSEDGNNYLRLQPGPEKPKRVSQKKRADAAILEAFRNSTEILPANAKYSAASMMKNKSHKVETPREYQIELFERAKQKNIVAVLPTGSGKTFIACLLLTHILEKEVEDRESGKPERIAFFLVDKVSLVFQQHAFLDRNLEHDVARFCGEMVDHMWSHDFWAKNFKDNKVIVCTAAILHKCLAHSYIRMDQINLLIFDEAHHTKKDHPYARIMKDFYMKVSAKERRPKVFGMTASPVDAQTDVKIAAARLEGLLHSEIATIADDSISLKSHIHKVTEVEVHYSMLTQPFETELYRKVSNLVRFNRHFSKELLFARNATSFLGPWMADRLWQLFLTKETILRLKQRTDLTYYGLDMSGKETSAVEKLRDVIDAHEFSAVEPTAEHLSTKVFRLWEELRARFSEPTDRRCIVFVDMRLTALLLADLFQQDGMELPGLKPSVLIGSQSDGGIANMSFTEQIVIMNKFQHGHFNCLFATQVAEEGIDIPGCDLVIRFDLYRSAIQYIQSKGRARKENSEYVTFMEGGNGRHSRTVAQATYDQATLRRFCNALPEDRKISGLDVNASVLQGESHYKSYVIESTGAKLTWMSSLEVLANFAAAFASSENDEMLAPEYLVTNQGPNFIAEVQLSSASPIQSMIGFPQKNKQAARCSAAFEMCKELIKKKQIDHYLQPIFVKKLPAMRNARLAISANKKAEYHMRTKPEIWSKRGLPDRLFVTVLKLETPEAIDRPSRPLILLTRERLPDLTPIPLFFENDQQSYVRPITLTRPIQVSTDDLEALKAFTFRIFKDVFSKEYEGVAADVPYFLAPTIENHSAEFPVDGPPSLIDWEHLRITKEKEYLDWNDDTPENFFEDKLVIDPYAGSRKLYLRGVRKDMKPMDPVPEGVPPPAHRSWKDTKNNIQEYSVSLWGKSRKARVWRQTQPVVEAEVVSLRRNLLDEYRESRESREKGSRVCYVILEPLRVSTLPIETVAMAFAFPAIMHRMDSAMIALDACNHLNLRIRPDLALEAMTKDSDNSDEHDKEKINFQSGMGNNYERLEFLGDCFLKMATTIAVFTAKPDDDEFEYHCHRMVLICNKNLFNHAVDRKLQEYIRSTSFDRRSWYPQGLELKRGKQGRLLDAHALADKSIADVCEALIGAAYLTNADSGDLDMAIRAVTVMVNNKIHPMTSWGDYYAAFTPPAWQTRQETAMQRDVARQIKEKLGYEFRSPALLRSAFKHPSFPKAYEDLPNYQRLEFLGDALLDMVCVDFLFNRFPDADPQWLTEHKMAMVSNQFLASLCVNLGLQKHIMVGTSALMAQTAEYVSALDLTRSEAEAQADDRGLFSQDYWVNVKKSPKYLSDVVEAYVGALFVDSGYDYNQIRVFFDSHIRPFFTDMALYDSFASKHPVTRLGHMLHETFTCHEWRLMAGSKPPPGSEGAETVTGNAPFCLVLIHGDIRFCAYAESGRYAKIAAAKLAIAGLQEMSTEDFKKAYECDCKVGEGDAVDHGTAV